MGQPHKLTLRSSTLRPATIFPVRLAPSGSWAPPHIAHGDAFCAYGVAAAFPSLGREGQVQFLGALLITQNQNKAWNSKVTVSVWGEPVEDRFDELNAAAMCETGMRGAAKLSALSVSSAGLWGSLKSALDAGRSRKRYMSPEARVRIGKDSRRRRVAVTGSIQQKHAVTPKCVHASGGESDPLRRSNFRRSRHVDVKPVDAVASLSKRTDTSPGCDALAVRHPSKDNFILSE